MVRYDIVFGNNKKNELFCKLCIVGGNIYKFVTINETEQFFKNSAKLFDFICNIYADDDTYDLNMIIEYIRAFGIKRENFNIDTIINTSVKYAIIAIFI